MIFNKIRRITNLWLKQFFLNLNNKRCNDNDSVVILKLDAIGDFIIWLDIAKEFKKIYKEKKCVLLCNPVCKELADVTGYFDEVITISIRDFESSSDFRKKTINFLNSLKFGTLVNSVYSRTLSMDLISAEIPANKKIAFRADESKLNLSRRFLTNKTKQSLDSIYDELIFTSYEEKMELQRNKDLIKGLGQTDFKSSIPVLPRISSKLVPSYKYFVVFPGASSPLKRWSTDNYARVINYVLSNSDYKCLVCGSKSESILFAQICEKISDKSRLINFCGKTSILELISVVQCSKFVISNDTSGIHIAVASNIQSICVCGSFNYGRFMPYVADVGNCNTNVFVSNVKCMSCKLCSNQSMSITCFINILLKKRYLCLEDITSNEVLFSIKKILGNVLITNVVK